MTPDRSIAVTVMEGLNCVSEIAAALDEGIPSEADHSWLDTLPAMEKSFVAIRAGDVVTSMIVGDELIERVRRVREMVSRWLEAGHPPHELKGQVDAVLAAFGLPLATGENGEVQGAT